MSVTEAIEALKSVSKDLVALPSDSAYDELTGSYFSELERELRPAAYLTPTSAQGVSKIVKTLRPFQKYVRIAVCGSGQQATPAVANVRDGLTIHLRGLRGIEIDSERKTISVAAGENMGTVYEKAVASGLGVSGNRHSSGGIGGDAVQGESPPSYLSCSHTTRWSVVLLVRPWICL